MNFNHGIFTISLDFELAWGAIGNDGCIGKKSLEETKIVIEKLLHLFKKYNIHATWATVGFLYYTDFLELNAELIPVKPTYAQKKFSSYDYINKLGNDDIDIYFAPHLLNKIRKTRFQEIATHTFSHYYCLENGQTIKQFDADLHCALRIAQKNADPINSIVFPRNQHQEQYLDVLKKYNIQCYRGCQKNWAYASATTTKGNSYFKKAARFLDAYINSLGCNTYSLKECKGAKPYNLAASCFYRAYRPKLKFMEPLKERRVKNTMLKAAKKNELFHMWWHPHNFGVNIDKNLHQLETILQFYISLQQKFGMKSLNMYEVTKILDNI